MKNIVLIPVLCICWALSSCSADSSSEGSLVDGGSQGQGGSLARFTIASGHLFAVNGSKLKVFDISNPNNVQYLKDQEVGANVETIFARDNATVFIGTQSGMLVYDVSDAPQVQYLSGYEHVVSCDPVVANQTHAYVTLHTEIGGGRCWRGVNQMDVLDVRDLRNIRLINSLEMTSPKGLGLYGDTLLVCDDGIKVYDINQPESPRLIRHETDVDAVDIIPNGNLMLIGTRTGLEQYRYHNGQLTFLSRI